MEEKQQALYLPSDIKSKRDPIQGFDKKALFQLSIVIAISLILAFIIYGFSDGNSFNAVGEVFLVVSAGIVLLRKNDSNQSVVDLAKYIIIYYRSQNVYPYIYLDEWE